MTLGLTVWEDSAGKEKEGERGEEPAQNRVNLEKLVISFCKYIFEVTKKKNPCIL